MTVTATDLLLEATDVSKTYGAVVALRSASLAVRPGEVHALMGANGAGKSTLVKILTGAVRPDTGAIVVRGRERVVHSPAEARRGGLVSVYQEPALIPDLDIRSNLRLTETPLEPFRHWLAELGLRRSRPVGDGAAACRSPRCGSSTSRAPSPSSPMCCMLDEMTAALPANLTERVLEVVGRQRGGDRSVIFISHRMIEIAAVCDRATVLREGETVGVVDVTRARRSASSSSCSAGIVGEISEAARRAERQPATRSADAAPRLTARAI